MIQVSETVHNIGDGLTVRPVITNAGTNTIAGDLQRVAYIKSFMRAFKKRVIAATLFSTRFGDVALEGTNKFAIPYYALITDASTNFDPATGYVMGDSNTGSVEVEINKRKYQSLAFSSAEARRQPNLNPEVLMSLKGDKLAIDVLIDILSLVTLTNFGAPAKTQAGSDYSSDDLADIKTACDQAQWPDNGRGLIVTPDIDGALLKDDTYKLAFAYGQQMVAEGKLPRVVGFDYTVFPSLPGNSENLIGAAVHRAAIAVGFSPVRPTEEVSKLCSYEIVTDTDTGISLEYRRWGNADFDQTREVVECNYGYALGNPAALKRLVSA